MKSKLFKKLIAGAATLAMVAQLGFVLPASAEGTPYFSIDFEDATDTTGWTSQNDPAGMSIATNTSVASINKYFKFANTSGSGTRTSYYTFDDAAKTLNDEKKAVMEFDFSMSANSGGSQLVVSDPSVGTPIGNGAYTKGYVFGLYQVDKNTLAVNTLDGSDTTYVTTGYTGGTWAHLKAVMDFNDHTVVMTIKSLDGETTYFEENMLGMGNNSAASIAHLFIGQPRNIAANCGVDNIVVREYVDGDVQGNYFLATFNVDGTVSTKTADKTTGLIAEVPETSKTGYIFDGWHKDDDTETLIPTETVLSTPLTANTTYTAVYSKDDNYIEPLTSVEFSSFPNGGIPTAGADADTPESNIIQVKLIGELGNDLLADENKDDRVTDLDVQWEFDGFRTVVSKDEPTTDTEGNTYCDSYAEVVKDENDPTKVDFQLKSQAFNFYGQVKATVTYYGKTITISSPMSIIPDKTPVAGQILPKAGYVSDFDLYEDTMVGYKATTSANNTDATDIVTGDWAAYGGNTGRGLYIAKDDATGEKFLKLKSTGTNSSSFAANKIDAPTGQVIISQDVRFYNSNSSILYKTKNPVSWDAKDTPAEECGATSISLDFTGSSIKLNNAEIISATTGVWYHIVLSADVTSKLCYAMIYDMDGTLLGKSDIMPFLNPKSTAPVYLCYRTPDNSNGELDFNDVKVYTPEIDGDLITTISNDTLIIPSTEVSDGISYKDGTVTVKDENAEDNSTATLICASYSGEKLSGVNQYSLTFKDGMATASVKVANGSKLMVWDSLEGMVPLYDAVTVTDTSGDTSATSTLTVDALSTEGYSMIGDAEWSVVDAATNEASDFVTITADADNSHKATLSVIAGAAGGTYTVTVSLGGKTKTIPVTVTGTQDSVKFTASTSSIAIPLEDGASNDYTYSAIVVDKDNNDLGKTVTYAMYDKNNANEITSAKGVSFNKETGVLTVTSEAQAVTVYIRATSTNSDDEPISRSLKVDIHGLAFDFGTADAVAEGYTAVAPNTVYTEAAGYGISSGTATAGGEAVAEDADSDNLTGTFKFQAKVEAGKVYTVTINYNGTVASEYVNVDLTGVVRTNESKSAVVYEVPVIDDVLDLSFTSSTVSSIVIEKQADKQPGGKPQVYTVGDSTIANNGSWAYVLARDIANYTDLANMVTFTNNGRGGKNLSTYYTGGELIDRVLTQVKPGDYVMIGDMGTNGMGSKFEESFNYYVDACEAMGAKIILNSYSPHMVDGGTTYVYNSGADKPFNNWRQDAYDVIVRKIYEERTTVDGEKYDEKVVGFVDISNMGDAAFNAYIADYEANGFDSADAAAQTIIACAGSPGQVPDHNHYGNGTIACQLMVEGYGDGDDAKGIVKSLVEILKADLGIE